MNSDCYSSGCDFLPIGDTLPRQTHSPPSLWMHYPIDLVALLRCESLVFAPLLRIGRVETPIKLIRWLLPEP